MPRWGAWRPRHNAVPWHDEGEYPWACEAVLGEGVDENAILRWARKTSAAMI